MHIIDRKIGERESPAAVEIWNWLRNLVDTLGHDGMSSEETSLGSDIEVGLQVKRLLWRRKIEKELNLIDSAEKNIKGYMKAGTKPMRQICSNNHLVSSRTAVDGLPRLLYDDEWFKEDKRQELTLHIPDVQWDWMHITVLDNDL
jgi:hypothetical protein